MVRHLNQELIGSIIDIFDDFLEAKGIDLQNPEKEESENPAVFYGTDYGIVQSELEDLLCVWSKGNVINPFVDDHGREEPAEMVINTIAGDIIARPNTDPGAPGLNIAYKPAGDTDEIDMVIIENKVEEDYRTDEETGDEILMYVYGASQDDYTDKFRFEKDGSVRKVE